VDPHNDYSGLVKVGDPVSITYGYAKNILDTTPNDPTIAVYDGDGPPNGLSVSINGYLMFFMNIYTSKDRALEVTVTHSNDTNPDMFALYTQSPMELGGSQVTYGTAIVLRDAGKTANPSDALPLTALNVSSFPTRSIQINSTNTSYNSSISATIDSMQLLKP
jgi:hypothetical protein